MKKLSIALLIGIMLLIAGCGNDIDCSEQDTTYTKYGLNEETGECEVVQELERDVCGNGIIEEGETYCNCPEDVPETHPEYGCEGEVGEYLEKACVQDQCLLRETSRVVETTQELEFSNRDVDIRAELTLNEPFIISDDVQNVIRPELELFSTSSNHNIKNVRVSRFSIYDGSSRLAREEINREFEDVGSTITVSPLELSSTTDYQSRLRLEIRIPVSYSKEYLDRDGDVTRVEEESFELTARLPRWDFINPEFYEE